MNIRLEFPPNYEDICAVFRAVRSARPVFAWGSTIFNPHRIEIGRGLFLHESVHGERQAGKPQEWWDQYLTSAEFRLAEEIPAHRVQYQHHAAGLARPQRRLYLRASALSLSSRLYGNMVTLHEAKRLIAGSAEL